MQIKLDARNGIQTFEARADEPVLYAGLRQGLALPYECGTGTCGTCRGRARDLTAIADRWLEAPGGKRLKREKGDFLMCQGRATAGCEIVVPSDVGPLPEDEQRPDWRRGRLVSLRPLTHDVAAFAVELDAPMDFAAGQFVAVEAADVRGFRAYSMVNHAPGTHRLELVVKRKPGGGFSEWLFGAKADGAELKIFGPLGRAVFRPAEDKNVLCIAGGTGLAGMMAILAHGVSQGYYATHRGDLFFGIRTMRDVFYGEELATFARSAPGKLSITIALSDEAPPARPPYGTLLNFERGFVHEVAARSMAGRYDNVVAFLAGPTPMVDGALRTLATDAKVPRQFIRYDKFN